MGLWWWLHNSVNTLKNHWLVCFQWVNFWAYKLHFNKAVLKKKKNTPGHIFNTKLSSRKTTAVDILCMHFFRVIIMQHFTAKYGACVYMVFVFLETEQNWLIICWSSTIYVPDMVLDLKRQWGTNQPRSLPSLSLYWWLGTRSTNFKPRGTPDPSSVLAQAYKPSPKFHPTILFLDLLLQKSVKTFLAWQSMTVYKHAGKHFLLVCPSPESKHLLVMHQRNLQKNKPGPRPSEIHS